MPSLPKRPSLPIVRAPEGSIQRGANRAGKGRRNPKIRYGVALTGRRSADEARLYAIECGRQCYLGDNPLDKEVLRNLSIDVTDRQGTSNLVVYSDLAAALSIPTPR